MWSQSWASPHSHCLPMRTLAVVVRASARAVAAPPSAAVAAPPSSSSWWTGPWRTRSQPTTIGGATLDNAFQSKYLEQLFRFGNEFHIEKGINTDTNPYVDVTSHDSNHDIIPLNTFLESIIREREDITRGDIESDYGLLVMPVKRIDDEEATWQITPAGSNEGLGIRPDGTTLMGQDTAVSYVHMLNVIRVKYGTDNFKHCVEDNLITRSDL